MTLSELADRVEAASEKALHIAKEIGRFGYGPIWPAAHEHASDLQAIAAALRAQETKDDG